VLLDSGFWTDGGINFYERRTERSETCISGMALVCWFQLEDGRFDRLAEHLLGRMAGGIAVSPGATAAPLTARFTPPFWRWRHCWSMSDSAPIARRPRARRRLAGANFWGAPAFRSHRTGKPVQAAMTRLAFPPQWHFDILRGLDYFRASGAPWDERLSDALELVEKKRRRGVCGGWRMSMRARRFLRWRPKGAKAAGIRYGRCGAEVGKDILGHR
jgi:hypothetical protein